MYSVNESMVTPGICDNETRATFGWHHYDWTMTMARDWVTKETTELETHPGMCFFFPYTTKHFNNRPMLRTEDAIAKDSQLHNESNETERWQILLCKQLGVSMFSTDMNFVQHRTLKQAWPRISRIKVWA